MENDPVNTAFLSLLKEVRGGMNFDTACDQLFEVVDNMISSGDLREIPDVEESDEVKLEWVRREFIKLAVLVRKELPGGG